MNYRENSAVSQSQLKNLILNPRKALIEEDSDSEHFLIGSATDILLTEGLHKFNDMYYTYNNTATGQMKDLLDYLVEHCDDASDSSLQLGYDFLGIKGSKFETIVDKFNSKYIDEYNIRISNKNKTLLTLDQYNIVFHIENKILSDKFTKQYFTSYSDSQIDLYGNIDGLDVKCLVDKLIIDEKNKTIQPLDLKTIGSSVFEFKKSYFKYRYDIQGSFYEEIIKQNYKGYKILPFKFIVVDSYLSKNPPLVYEMSTNELWKAKEGYKINSIEYKGWKELILEYNIRTKSGDWTYPFHYTGSIILDFDV